jgi:hypothetical protein
LIRAMMTAMIPTPSGIVNQNDIAWPLLRIRIPTCPRNVRPTPFAIAPKSALARLRMRCGRCASESSCPHERQGTGPVGERGHKDGFSSCLLGLTRNVSQEGNWRATRDDCAAKRSLLIGEQRRSRGRHGDREVQAVGFCGYDAWRTFQVSGWPKS